MGLFDKLKQATESVVRDEVQTASNKSVNVQFAKLPDTLDEFKALPQAQALQLLRSRAQMSPARQRQPQAAQQHRQARHRRQMRLRLQARAARRLQRPRPQRRLCLSATAR